MDDQKTYCRLVCENCGRKRNVTIDWLKEHFHSIVDRVKDDRNEIALELHRLICTACGKRKAILYEYKEIPITATTTKEIRSKQVKEHGKEKRITKYNKSVNKKNNNAKYYNQLERDEAIAIKQRNQELMKKQNDYKSKVSAKHRNDKDIFVIHSTDD
jgi:hypothetical protein